jgi:hypothetical protein
MLLILAVVILVVGIVRARGLVLTTVIELGLISSGGVYSGFSVIGFSGKADNRHRGGIHCAGRGR